MSGAGIIFGASGGVAEAALRLAAERVIGKRMDSFAYEGVRGLQGVKETTITLGVSKVRLAVVSGLQNAQKLIDRMRAGDALYDLIEVMACPGGCINGSGNPAPLLQADTEQRLDVLYVWIRKRQSGRARIIHRSKRFIIIGWGNPKVRLSSFPPYDLPARSMRPQEAVEETSREVAVHIRGLYRNKLFYQGFLEASGKPGLRIKATRLIRSFSHQCAFLHRPVRGRTEYRHR